MDDVILLFLLFFLCNLSNSLCDFDRLPNKKCLVCTLGIWIRGYLSASLKMNFVFLELLEGVVFWPTVLIFFLQSDFAGFWSGLLTPATDKLHLLDRILHISRLSVVISPWYISLCGKFKHFNLDINLPLYSAWRTIILCFQVLLTLIQKKILFILLLQTFWP